MTDDAAIAVRPAAASPWWSGTSQETLARLATSNSGLSEAEAVERLARRGPNALPEPQRRAAWRIGLAQLRNPLTAILLVAAVVSNFLGHTLDAIFICAVVIIDVILGAVQEWRAEESAASLKKTLTTSPTVIRDGVRRSIDLSLIVPGDLVAIESGAATPADLRLISADGLRIDESLLTGESTEQAKDAAAQVSADAAVGDRRNMAFAGSIVTSGRGVGVAVATGHDTELGKIARLLAGRGGKAPLLIRIEGFSAWIAIVTVILAVMIGAGQYFSGVGFSEVFLLTTALTVSAIPEGLPMAITVALSVASKRMSARNVIVRHLPAVEALGSCTVIATDKTGTLTANRLTVRRIVTATGQRASVSGEGLELEGDFAFEVDDPGPTARPAEMTEIIRLARIGIRTNDASLTPGDGAVLARGDMVDVALLVLATKAGIDPEAERRAAPVQDAIPYEPVIGFSASLSRESDGSAVVSVKGAPEKVLAMCHASVHAETSLHELTSGGFRVLAFAEKRFAAEIAPCSIADQPDLIRDLEFVGFVGLVDPLRSEAPAAVDAARAAGVDVRMITGDHPETARAIARELSASWVPERIITGRDLKALDDHARTEAILSGQIFARVEPADKTMIVRTLQKAGHFVAVTGDGVNDAPALKAAHVGVAMGARGADAARAAADLVIADDDFASIVAGIEEGRAAYDNIRKIVWLLVSTAIAEVVVFTLALATGLPVPLTAVQILWLNLVSEGIQDVALAFEAKEPGIMKRPPRRPDEPVFDRQMIEQCVLVGGYVGVVAFALFYWLYADAGHSEADARNVVLLFLVIFNNFQTLNCRSETRSVVATPLAANPLLIASVLGAQALHIAAMQMPLLRNMLGLQPVSIADWAGVLVLAASVLALGEAYKALVARPREERRRGKKAVPG